jgi:hypothetical protein
MQEKVTITSHTWDASTMIGADGQPDTSNSDVVELLGELSAIATVGGVAVTLPGSSPGQAVVITIQSPGGEFDVDTVQVVDSSR